MYARAHSGAIQGVDAVTVSVEVDTGPGIQNFHVVGLADGAVREARVRVKSAMENTGYTWPMRRVSLNLAPADLRKDGTAFDLPIALATMAASGEFNEREVERLGGAMVAGELSLDGEIRPVRGVLPLAIQARDVGFGTILVPMANIDEALVAEGPEVVGCRTLGDAVAWVRGRRDAPAGQRGDGRWVRTERTYAFDMQEIRGQEHARRALEVAAAGGHNVLLSGPPGSGKTMLSKRLLTILPEMTFEESLETTKIYSVAGLTRGGGLLTQRPFRAPHHTISDVGMVGGGSGTPRPGEISLAHNGILFLDELPEFRRNVLEVMRQPLEDGVVTISRSLVTVAYPARIMLVASMNPCPCGYLGDPSRACTDTPQSVAQYRSRLSGPLLDRIDLQVEVPAIRYRELVGSSGEAEDSATIRRRVEAARAIQAVRFAGTATRNNAQMGPTEIGRYCEIDAEGAKLLEMVVDRLGMSARAYDRIRKVARTIADLAGEPRVRGPHVAEAIRYRGLDRRV